MECVTGCKYFTGGEVHHHKDCPFYPESMSKMFDEAQQRITELKAENEQYFEDFQILNRQKLEALRKLTKAEDILKERDGGGHDADCKIFRMVAKCNCGHQDVLDYFKNKS